MRRPHSGPIPAASALVALLVGAAGAASLGCGATGGGLPSFVSGAGEAEVTVPPTVRAQTGEGRLPVYGASLYSPGQEIYKELRQQESLMAFLACQGEPDSVEVVAHPGAPKIFLYYTRRGLDHKGTVEIYPSDAGFYAARPIDPKLRGPDAPSAEPAPGPKPRAEPKPEPAPKPPPPPPPSEPEEPEPPPEPAPDPEAESRWPEPTPQQRDDCPIEPWRRDCRELCADDAPWEWCDYQD